MIRGFRASLYPTVESKSRNLGDIQVLLLGAGQGKETARRSGLGWVVEGGLGRYVAGHVGLGDRVALVGDEVAFVGEHGLVRPADGDGEGFAGRGAEGFEESGGQRHGAQSGLLAVLLEFGGEGGEDGVAVVLDDDGGGDGPSVVDALAGFIGPQQSGGVAGDNVVFGQGGFALLGVAAGVVGAGLVGDEGGADFSGRDAAQGGGFLLGVDGGRVEQVGGGGVGQVSDGGHVKLSSGGFGNAPASLLSRREYKGKRLRASGFYDGNQVSGCVGCGWAMARKGCGASDFRCREAVA